MFHHKPNERRQVFLALAGSVESQLRDAFAKRVAEKQDTQATLAHRLGISSSAVQRRLSGRTNMNIEALADMVWALGLSISVEIFDPNERPSTGGIA